MTTPTTITIDNVKYVRVDRRVRAQGGGCSGCNCGCEKGKRYALQVFELRDPVRRRLSVR